jgi:hypothetical protein
MTVEPPSDEPIEPGKMIPVNINQLFGQLPPDQMKQLDLVKLLQLWIDAGRDARTDDHRFERARWSDRVRMILITTVLGVIVLEFAVAAAILVWADEDWDELKDLLAYCLAPFAAIAGAAAAYYFAPRSTD